MARAGVAVLLVVATLGTVPAEARAPVRLMVLTDEYSLVLSRQTIERGPALVQVVNRGEDPHDLKLRRFGDVGVSSVPEVVPGTLRTQRVRLRAGRYHLWCSLAGHRELGMRATLRVRRRGS